MNEYAYARRPEGADFAVRKQKIIDSLTDSYARDAIDADEYERRVGKAQEAGTIEDLEAVLAGLPAGASGVKDGQTGGTAYSDNSRNSGYAEAIHPETAFCLMSGRNMSGNRLSKGAQVFALMGGVNMDFRNTRLPPGETKVEVFAMMGGVEIIVPPGLAVNSSLIAIMGGTDIKRNVKTEPYPGEPYLTISGLVLMGGVDVKAKP